MINILEFLIKKTINNDALQTTPSPIPATGDKTTWYYYQYTLKNSNDKFCSIEHPTEQQFIDAFSNAWYPGEGDSFNSISSRYIAHYMATVFDMKCIKVVGSIRHQHKTGLTIYCTSLDSKSRKCNSYIESNEDISYVTNGGYHGNESDIHWTNYKHIKSRKDFAKIVLNLMNTLKNENT